MSATETAAPALKEIFNAERLQHIATETVSYTHLTLPTNREV